VLQVTDATLWNACDNWYTGSTVPGKPQVFMPYVDWVGFIAICKDVVRDNYKGFTLN
jgi:cyclohexanone monooxygenase